MPKKPFFKSFVWRFQRVTFAIIVICLLGTMGLVAVTNYIQTLKKLENRAQSMVQLASVSLQDALLHPEQPALIEAVEALMQNGEIVAIKVLPNKMEKNVVQIKEPFKSSTFDALLYKDGFIIKEALVVKNGTGVGRIQIITDAREALEGSLMHLLIIGGGMLVLVLLIGISSWLIYQKSVQPAISGLMENMDQILIGEIFRMETERPDELGDLARQFSLMYNNVQNKIGNLQMVNTTVGLLAMSTDQTRALEIGMEMMQIQTNVKRGSVYILDTDQKLKAVGYYPKMDRSLSLPSKEFKLGEGILGKVAETQKIIYVPNTAIDSEFVSGDAKDGESKALLCVPMTDSKEVFGVMNFSGVVGEVSFSVEDGDDRVAITIARLTMLVTKMLSLDTLPLSSTYQSEGRAVDR